MKFEYVKPSLPYYTKLIRGEASNIGNGHFGVKIQCYFPKDLIESLYSDFIDINGKKGYIGDFSEVNDEKVYVTFILARTLLFDEYIEFTSANKFRVSRYWNQ